MTDDRHYDALETRDPAERHNALYGALPEFVSMAKNKAAGWAGQLADVDADELSDPAAFRQVPVLRKGDLLAQQKEHPPFGGFTTSPAGSMGRLFMSPGPIFDPEGRGHDWWRVGRALYAAGVRRGQILHNSFAYHLTPAGHMFESGAHAIGCAVIPAGIGNTEMQLQAINDLRPDGYAGTPDYLKILLDAAADTGKDASSLKKGLVSGAALPGSLRRELSERGVDVVQCYGTADLGIVAYESEAQEGMIVDEQVIVEIVKPGTGDPVVPGDVGEVVVTSFNMDYPMIRFATGDLSAFLDGSSPCGRTNSRIKGWMGRADQATKVRGMFVRPEQVVEIAKRHPELGRLRLVVSRSQERDVMVLKAEHSEPTMETDALEETLQSMCKLRGQVELVSPGSLPNDGVVIADERSYE